MKSVVLTLKYIRYFFTAQTKHDIHSPFVYKLVTSVINQHEKKPVFKVIENRRSAMLDDDTMIKIRDYGAGFGGKKYKEKKIRFIAQHAAKSKKYGRLLHHLVAYFSPEVLLEMGTSVGISAMYQASAAPHAKMISLEGCENTAAVAMKNFEATGMTNIRLITGDFEETLPFALAKLNTLDFVFLDGNHKKVPVLGYFNACLAKAHRNSCFVIDDINWSEEMSEAWKEIKLNPKVTVTIDLFMLGLVFFNPDLSKENFTIRF